MKKYKFTINDFIDNTDEYTKFVGGGWYAYYKNINDIVREIIMVKYGNQYIDHDHEREGVEVIISYE